MINKNDIADLIQASNIAGFEVDESSLKLDYYSEKERQLFLIDWKKGERLNKAYRSIPYNHSAIYTFFLNDSCLKVGKAGLNSNARFKTQHYKYKSAKSSSLPKALINQIDNNKLYPHVFENTNDCYNKLNFWIKENTIRQDIFIEFNGDNKKHHNYFVNFCEAFFILRLKPLFEGS